MKMKKLWSFAVVLAMIVSLFSGTLGAFADTSAGVETAYGTIPAEYADASAYPIAVFFSDKTLLHVGSDWKTAMKQAINICSYGYGANIFLRNDISVESSFNNLENITKPLVIDLNGYNISLTSAYLGMFANTNSLDVTVKNGSVTVTNSPLFNNFNYYDNSGYTASMKYENVTFAFGSGAAIENPILGHNFHKRASEIINETYVNCTFDFRENCPSNVTLFEVDNGPVEKNITVKGCKLLADDMSKITVMQKNNTGSSIVFDKYNGEYMTISVPTGSDSSAFESYVFPTAEGELVANFDSTAEGYDTYKLGTAPAPVVPVETAYGKIPAEYADASAYPIAVFFSDKTFLHAGSDWKTAMSQAISICSYGYGANIFLRNDISVESSFNSLEYITKPLVIDLNGYNISLTSGYLGMFANTNSLDVTVKNGSVTVTNSPLFNNFNYYDNSGYTASMKYENVTFAFGSGAAIENPILGHNFYNRASEIINETYVNCTFDFRGNCPSNVTLFEVDNGPVEKNITVKGCKLLADDMSKITVMQKNNTGSSIVFDKYNGEYMTISVPTGSDSSAFESYVFPTAEGELVADFDSTAEGYDTYKLGTAPAPVVPVETAYGKIPAEYADANAYPIAVFFSDKTLLHVGSDWKTAMDKAISISSMNYGAVILIRDDITINEADGFNNLSYITNGLVIDLGGNNVELAGAYLGLFENKYELDVTVKNGSFTLTKNPVFKNFHCNNTETVYSPIFNFEDVTFSYGSGATLTDPVIGDYVAATGPEVFTETYTNCTFDFRDNCPNGVVLFQLGIDGAGVIKHNVTVNGCKLLADDMSKITVMQKNNTGSSIVFNQYNGEYMTLSVPEGSAVCNEVFPLANEKGRYVLDSTNDGTSLYKLAGGIFMVADGNSVKAYNIDSDVDFYVAAYSATNELLYVGVGDTTATVYTADWDKTDCERINAFLWDGNQRPLCLPLVVPFN